MRIYYVANARMPNEKAHGIQLAKQCEAFCEEGLDLELVIPRQGNMTGKSVREYYELARDIPIHTVFVPRLGSSRLGFNLRALFFALSSFFYLRKKVRDSRNSVIYTIDLDQFSFFLLPLLHSPVFFEVHGSKARSIFLSFFMRRVRGVIANSRTVAEKMIHDFSVPTERVIVAHNGIDLKMFPSPLSKIDARKKLGMHSDKKVAVHTGQFYDWKGLGILADVARLHPEIRFYVVGGEEVSFRQTTGVETIPMNLRCVGHQPFREVPWWIAAADVLLALGTQSNAYSYTETSPMKLFEFLASGRPIVASRTPANCEIVSDAEVFFYEPDHVHSLSDALKEALSAGDHSPKIVAAHEKAKCSTWKERTKKIMNFIATRV